MLGLSIDEMDDLEDLDLGAVNGISFIAEEDFVSRYGEDFHIYMREDSLTLAVGRSLAGPATE